MKKLRKSMLLIFVAVFSLAIGLFAVACGGSKVSLSFDWGDGQVAKVEVAPGEEVQIPAGHERDGYFFQGWYDNSNFTGTKYEGKLTAPEKDTTYYARWAKGYTVSLNPDIGGTISGGDSVLVPEGGNILEYLNGHSASKGSLQFGAWFEGDREITSSDVMPARDIELTAKYKAEYTVTVFTQKAPNVREYEENSELSFKDYEYVGTHLSLASRAIPNYTILHNYSAGEAKTVEELDIAEDSSLNKFTLYCDREAYTIIYDSNAPQGVNVIGRMADQRFVYGETAAAFENGFTIEGYLFAGWSQDRSGSIKYQPGATLENGSCTLYAIWDKGYGDMFGGTDYIYFPRLTPEKVILMRGNYSIDGTYDRATSIATFSENLKAKILGERFAFYSEARNTTYTLYSGYYGDTAGNETLTIDGYYGVTLSSGATGSIAYNAQAGCYTLSVGGKESNILLSKNGNENVFLYIGIEAGTYTVYQRTVSEMMYGYDYIYTLDGAGTVIREHRINGSRTTGSYKKPDTSNEVFPITMHFAGEDESEFLVYGNVGNGNIGIIKNQEHAGEYKSTDGGTLYLDGYNGMEESYYTPKDGTATPCEYYVEDTIRGTVAHVTVADPSGSGMTSYAFVLTRGTGESKEYTFEKITAFTSYRMIAMDSSSGQNVFTAYVLVVDEEAFKNEESTDEKIPDGAKKAYLYYDMSIASGTDATEKPVLLYEGYVEDNTQSTTEPFSKFKAVGDFKGTVEGGEQESGKNDELKDALPYKDNEFKFHTSDQSPYGNIFYTYGTIKTKDKDGKEVEQQDYLTYTEEGTSNTLVIGAFNAAENYGMDGKGSFYITDTGYMEGGVSVYKTNGQDPSEFGVTQYLLFQYTNADLTLANMYIATHGEAGQDVKFEFLQDAPRFLTKALTNVSVEQSLSEGFASLRLDGNGKAVYYQARENAQSHQNGIKGDYSFVSWITIGGVSEALYSFNSNEMSFNFVLNSMLEESYNMECEEWPEGDYAVTNGGHLQLDGYGSRAVYTDNFGNVTEGLYYYETGDDNNFLIIYDPNNTNQQGGVVPSMYFTYDAQKNLSAVTMELQANGWLMVDSSYNTPFGENVFYIAFDGKEVKIYDYYTGAQVGTGNYDALAEEGRYLVNAVFDDNSLGHRTYTVQLGIYQQQTPYCMLQDAETAGSYLAADNTVFYLDGFGAGFLVDKEGFRTDGDYLYLDDDYIVFEDDNMEVFVIKFEKSDWTFSVVNKDTSKYVTYYAPDFTAVEFGEILRINGQAVAYWFYEGDKPVYYTLNQETGAYDKSDSIPYNYKNDQTYEITFGEGQEGEQKVTYYRWEKNQTFTMKGSLVFDYFNKKEAKTDESESGKWEGMEITFTPDGTSALNAPATLKFKHNSESEDIKGYRVEMQFPRTSSGTLHFAYLVFDELELRLDIEAADNETKNENSTFTLHAAVTNETPFIDYVHDAYGGYSYGTLYAGSNYTIGAKRWPVSKWNSEVEYLLSGRFNIFDVSGQYLTVQMNYKDAFTEKTLIGADATFNNIPIYRILTTGADGVTYSLNLDVVTNEGYYVFLPYSICVYNVLEPEGDSGETYVVEQFIASYRTSLMGEQIPNLGVVTCEILVDGDGEEGEESKKVNLLENYTVNIWDVNVAIAEYHAPEKDEDSDAQADEGTPEAPTTSDENHPAFYVVWFDLDDNGHVEKGHYREAKQETVTDSNNKFQLQALIVEGENGKPTYDGFIPLVLSVKGTGTDYTQVQLLDWTYDESAKEFTIIYSLDENMQNVAAVKIKITESNGSYTLDAEEVDLEDLQDPEGAGTVDGD